MNLILLSLRPVGLFCSLVPVPGAT